MEKGRLSYGDAIGSQKILEEGVLITCPLPGHSILHLHNPDAKETPNSEKKTLVMGVAPGHACISANLHSREPACFPSAAQQHSRYQTCSQRLSLTIKNLKQKTKN